MQHVPATPALERLRQEDVRFELSLAHITRPCLRHNNKQKNNKTKKNDIKPYIAFYDKYLPYSSGKNGK